MLCGAMCIVARLERLVNVLRRKISILGAKVEITDEHP